MPNESTSATKTEPTATESTTPPVVTGSGVAGDVANTVTQSSGVQSDSAASSAGEQSQTVDVLLPAEFKDRGWAKTLAGKPVDQFFREYDHAQSLLGKKQFGVPDENATEEQRKEFLKAFGVPETIDGYEMPKIEWGEEEKVSGEFLAGQRDDAFIGEIKGLAHKLGISKKQFEQLAEGYDRAFVKAHSNGLKAIAETHSQLAQDFTQIVSSKYGDRTDEVLSNAKAIVDKFAPELKPLLAAADNNVLAGVVELAENIRKVYISDDDMSALSPVTSSGSAGGTLESMEAARLARRAQDDFRNPRHPNHANAKREVDEMTAAFVKAQATTQKR